MPDQPGKRYVRTCRTYAVIMADEQLAGRLFRFWRDTSSSPTRRHCVANRKCQKRGGGIKIIILFATIHSHPQARETMTTSRYIVTIDGGSSGSRVHVHQVVVPTATAASDDDQLLLPEIQTAVNKKIKPGLSSFEKNPSDVEQHMNDLLEFALLQVPKKEWNNTPIYLKATAGLRSIPTEASQQILKVCRLVMADSPLRFEKPHEWARIISGTEEGMFSFLAVNFLTGSFNNDKESSNGLLGIIEMGGASMQISYPLKPNQAVTEGEKDLITTVDLGNKSYQLVVYSYLGYGLDMAQELLVEQAKDQVGSCYPPGYEIIKAIDKNDNAEYSSAASSIAGRGDYHQCYDAMNHSLFDKSKCPATGRRRLRMPNNNNQHRQLGGQLHCTFNGIVLPDFDHVSFVALENFYYTTSFFKVDDQLNLLNEKGMEFCSRDWNAIVQEHQANENEDEDSLKRYCFSSAYIPALLKEGFQIQDLASIEIARSVGGTDIDWVVGSVVHDVLRDQHQNHHSHHHHQSDTYSSASTITPWATFLFCLVILPVCVIVVSLFVLRGRKRIHWRARLNNATAVMTGRFFRKEYNAAVQFS
jgi:apyrase